MKYKITATTEFIEDLVKLFNNEYNSKNFDNLSLRIIRSNNGTIESILLTGWPKNENTMFPQEFVPTQLISIPLTKIQDGENIKTEKSIGELFDEYVAKGYNFFDHSFLLNEGERLSEELDNDIARLIIYSLMVELKDYKRLINDVEELLKSSK